MRLDLPVCVLLFAGIASSQDTPKPDPDEVRTEDGLLVARIARTPHDADNHRDTSKVFHHVFAPDGRLLTKGTGGEFDHHRGLFIGWNQTGWHGKRFDFWHCNHGESLRFVGWTPAAEHHFGKGWQVADIDWCIEDGTVAATERRALRARRIAADVTAIDLAVRLRPCGSELQLAGDPQHAGQQFRALQQFAEKDAPKAAYLRPESAIAHDNDVWTDCAWIAQVLPFEAGAVTVLRLEGPENPKPTTWSTRAYGRFGATFTHTITAGDMLDASWTYVLALGERDAAWCARTAEQQREYLDKTDAGRERSGTKVTPEQPIKDRTPEDQVPGSEARSSSTRR
ncbi:MAG: PmoA family protein [Planctomycetes bacterium]|nr:PmoA family protein [Planctomycetota bacterium]